MSATWSGKSQRQNESGEVSHNWCTPVRRQTFILFVIVSVRGKSSVSPLSASCFRLKHLFAVESFFLYLFRATIRPSIKGKCLVWFELAFFCFRWHWSLIIDIFFDEMVEKTKNLWRARWRNNPVAKISFLQRRLNVRFWIWEQWKLYVEWLDVFWHFLLLYDHVHFHDSRGTSFHSRVRNGSFDYWRSLWDGFGRLHNKSSSSVHLGRFDVLIFHRQLFDELCHLLKSLLGLEFFSLPVRQRRTWPLVGA